jgi:hypothetical protein
VFNEFVSEGLIYSDLHELMMMWSSLILGIEFLYQIANYDFIKLCNKFTLGLDDYERNC